VVFCNPNLDEATFPQEVPRSEPAQSLPSSSTRKCMSFVNTTAIACGQKIGQTLMILVVCNAGSSCVHKRHAFASRDCTLSVPSQTKKKKKNQASGVG